MKLAHIDTGATSIDTQVLHESIVRYIEMWQPIITQLQENLRAFFNVALDEIERLLDSTSYQEPVETSKKQVYPLVRRIGIKQITVPRFIQKRARSRL